MISSDGGVPSKTITLEVGSCMLFFKHIQEKEIVLDSLIQLRKRNSLWTFGQT